MKMSLLLQGTTARLLRWSILPLAVGSITLMLYALMWEAGNIVNLPNKRIGFYNFCLWNQTTGELQCLQFKDLRELGISQVEMVLARLCVYTAQVLSLFSPFFILQPQCANKGDRKAWEVTFWALGLSAALLAGGLGLFLLQIWNWILLSELSGAFMALSGAQVLQVLQLFAAAACLQWVQGDPAERSPFPEKQLPPLNV